MRWLVVEQGVEECDEVIMTILTLAPTAVTLDAAIVVHDGVEACDDGNDNNNDQCRNDCGFCGLWQRPVEQGEKDDNNQTTTMRANARSACDLRRRH